MIPEWAQTILQSYGLAGVVMAYLAWMVYLAQKAVRTAQERWDIERQELQKALITLSTDTIKVVTVMQGTIQSIKDLLSGRGQP